MQTLLFNCTAIRQEIKNIETGVWDKKNNPLRNAPHTQALCISSNWDKPYSREVAAYPIVRIKRILLKFFLEILKNKFFSHYF